MRRILPRLCRCLLLAIALAGLPAAAQMGSAQFGDFREEAQAFNQQDPFANAYRAGHYNGYLAGVLDALQGRSVCFRECVCELDKLVGQHLSTHPELRERPAIEWLAPLLAAHYPCK